MTTELTDVAVALLKEVKPEGYFCEGDFFVADDFDARVQRLVKACPRWHQSAGKQLLPPGYRYLIEGEYPQRGDEFLPDESVLWRTRQNDLNVPVCGLSAYPHRTRRPILTAELKGLPPLEMATCRICGLTLAPQLDCGGDCLFCMSELGDPDCKKHADALLRALWRLARDLADHTYQLTPDQWASEAREAMTAKPHAGS